MREVWCVRLLGGVAAAVGSRTHRNAPCGKQCQNGQVGVDAQFEHDRRVVSSTRALVLYSRTRGVVVAARWATGPLPIADGADASIA